MKHIKSQNPGFRKEEKECENNLQAGKPTGVAVATKTYAHNGGGMAPRSSGPGQPSAMARGPPDSGAAGGEGRERGKKEQCGEGVGAAGGPREGQPAE